MTESLVMPQLIAVLIPIGLLAFWAWMYSEMARTRNDRMPYCFITVTNNRDPRLDWNVAFIFLNIATAMYYYVKVYRHRR